MLHPAWIASIALTSLPPLFAWSWRSWFAIVGPLGAFLTWIWIDEARLRLQMGCGHDFGFEHSIAVALGQLATAGFLACAASRGIGLTMQYAARQRRVDIWWMDVVSLVLFAVIVLLGPYLAVGTQIAAPCLEG